LHIDYLWSPRLYEPAFRLLIAVVLGGLVGYERERSDRPAGLRTHILVCVGAALIAAVDHAVPQSQGKIAGQVVTGVGFLGAGTIIRDSSEPTVVRGLTTAASLWATAGIGIAVGYGAPTATLAIVGTVLVLFTLVVLTRFEGSMNSHRMRQRLMIVLRADKDPMTALSRILEIFRGRNVRTRDLLIRTSADAEVVDMQLTMPHGMNRDTLSAALTTDSSIVHYEWVD
jgi:putative Mg2+ transporter-C (MgtC) family protein